MGAIIGFVLGAVFGALAMFGYMKGIYKELGGK